MSIEQNQHLLVEVAAGNGILSEAARVAHHYTELCLKGEISKEEYVELIADIQREANIKEGMNDLENLQRLNTAINGLISIAKMV